MNGLRSDPERLRQRAHELDEFARRARGVAEELRKVLDATGACWGDDEIGRSFAAAYLADARQALDGIGGLESELREVAARFAEAASEQQRAGSTAERGRIVGQG